MMDMLSGAVAAAVAYNVDRGYSLRLWTAIQMEVRCSAVDGIPGPETARRVAAWQRDNGLKADGKVGPITLARLTENTPQLPPEGAERNRDSRRIARDESRPIWADVSVYQGSIDWPMLSAWSGLSGVIIKATQSRTKRGGVKPFIDSRYAENTRCAKKSGMPWGSYHLAVVTRGDGSVVQPEEDAAYVASAVMGRVGPLGLWVDWETTWIEDGIAALGGAAQMADWMGAHLLELERLTGQRPGLYWSHRGVKRLGEHAARFYDACRNWWAYYYSDSKPLPKALAERPSKPQGLPWALWQFTSSGIVPGIKGDVDLIVVNREVSG